MDKSRLSHDILNVLERLRIMQELLKEQNFQHISKEEILKDLKANINELEQKFAQLAQ